MQDEQLGGVNLDWYDYGARMYDPALGRWHVPDPMAEFHHEYNPYHYTFNNPINFMDPLGLDTVPANTKNLVQQDDVVVMEDGSNATASADDVVVTPGGESDNESEQADLPETEIAETKEDNPAGEIMAGTLLLAGSMVLDDATIIGILDDPAIPFVLAGGAVAAGSVWIVHQFAKSKKGKASERQEDVKHGNQGTGKLKGSKKKNHQKRRPGDMGDKKRRGNWKQR